MNNINVEMQTKFGKLQGGTVIWSRLGMKSANLQAELIEYLC